MAAETPTGPAGRRRVGAVLFDGLIVGIPCGIVIGLALGNASLATQYGLYAVIYLAYTFGMLTRSGGHNGQTLGKQALGLQIVRDDGAPVSAGTVLVREILFKGLLDGITFGILALFDYLWPLGDSTNRALHDKLVHTHVLNINS